MKKFVLLFFVVIMLWGCEKQLTIPDNIRFENGILTWDKVKGAESYRIIIGDDIIYSEESFLDLSSFNEGQYDIYICAIRGQKETEYSNRFKININRLMQINMRIDNDILIWDQQDFAISYSLYIDEVKILEIALNQIALSDLDLESNSVYAFQIKIKYEQNTSPLSVPYYHHTYQQAESLPQTQIKLSDKEPFVMEWPDGEILTILSGNSKLDDWDCSEDGLSIDYAVFKNNKPGIYHYYIFTEDTVYDLPVKIVEGDKPYIVSDTTVYYQTDNDIVLTVELAGASFDGLLGNDITDNDYQLVDSKIIIFSNYIEKMVNENANRKTIVLLCCFRMNNTNIRTDIIIHLNENGD